MNFSRLLLITVLLLHSSALHAGLEASLKVWVFGHLESLLQIVDILAVTIGSQSVLAGCRNIRSKHPCLGMKYKTCSFHKLEDLQCCYLPLNFSEVINK